MSEDKWKDGPQKVLLDQTQRSGLIQQQANKLYFKNLYLLEKVDSTGKQNEGNVRN